MINTISYMMRAVRRHCFLAALGLLFSLLPAWSQISLVATGSVWKYFDQGSEPAGWRGLLFNDSAWSSGPGQLGFGDGDEATLVSQTNSAGVTNIAFYFRHNFNLFDPSIFTNLLLRIRRDDGAIVYLNEVEIFRSNMPPAPVNAHTLARVSAPDDGNVFFGGLVSHTLINIGDNQLAVEIHQAATNSSDISFDLEFLGNVDTANFQPPSVTLLSPKPEDTVGGNITVVANATDTDGSITAVEFFDGTSWMGTTTVLKNLYYVLSWTNLSPGLHVLSAVALDSTGLSSTSAPVSIHVLPAIIPRESAWKYLDDGSNAGTAWRNPGFNDSGWSNGIAQLGYGDGDEATEIGFGSNSASKYITTYFRRVFDVPNPAAITNLIVRLLRDDGVVVYLNGTEVYRDNMAAGAVTYTNTAVIAIEDDQFHGVSVSPALLVPGANVVAVEIHQASATSSDVSFDLELLSNVTPTPPAVRMSSPVNGLSVLGPVNLTLVAETSDVDSPVASVAFFDGATALGTALVNVVGDASLQRLFVPGGHTLRAVATDAMGFSTTSAPVSLTVIPAPLITTLVATGSVWRFFDTNVAPTGNWRLASFDDSGWRSGPGILGYGILGVSSMPATLINSGTNANNRQITSYFRRPFTASNVANITNLSFGVVRDDGAVVHLNGVEIFRMNMPPGPVSYATFAIVTNAVSGTNESYYFPTNIVPTAGMLNDGTNILAVELHQNAVTTSDAAFDLTVAAISPPGGLPALRASFDGVHVRLTWDAPGFRLLESGDPSGPYGPGTNAPSPVLITPTLPSRFYRLVQP